MRKRENVPKGIFERRPEPVGYTYIMADIHGMYELYLAMLEKIRFSPEDVLYVLGDANDRGRDGIRILQDFMKRDNITLLLGNHEDMMLRVATLEQMSGPEYEHSMYHWSRNGGDITAGIFFQCLSYKEQAKIIAYLESCPLFLPAVKVNGKNYCLVHACPDTEGLASGISGETVTADSLSKLNPKVASELKNTVLWKRLQGTEALSDYGTVLFGHTPTIHYQNHAPMICWHGENMINVDCGCAYLAAGRPEGQLGCLRLEDGKEFYLR